jgi:hypothetical protein
MKVLVLLALVGAAFAAPAPDSDLRQLVGYQGPSSTVTILRGADLGGDSGERVRVQSAPQVRIVAAPRPSYRTVQYVRPAPRIVYRQPEPQPIVFAAPRPEPRQRIIYQQPRVIARPTVIRGDSGENYGNDDAKYQFAYEVSDDYTANYQARQESRDGDRLEGVYSVLDPDGFLRTVKYGDEGYGFQAVVTREPSNLFGGSSGRTQYVVSRDDSSEQ